MTLHLTILSLWTLFSQQLDEGSRLLPILIASTGVAVYTVLVLVAFDVIDILEFRILIYLIVWHLYSRCLFIVTHDPTFGGKDI